MYFQMLEVLTIWNESVFFSRLSKAWLDPHMGGARISGKGFHMYKGVCESFC